MNKKVNIYPTKTIFALNPPIRSAVTNVTKPVEDIRACLIARAKVEEILPNGEKVNLNLTNFDKDNSKTEPVTVAPVEALSEPVIEEVPVVKEVPEVEEVEAAPEEVEQEVKEEVKEEAPKQENKKVDYNKHKNNNNKRK